MEETKACIACAEEIKKEAKLCKHCKTMQDDQKFKRPKIRENSHTCNHPSLNRWYEAYKNEPGLPKIEGLLEECGSERVVAYFFRSRPLGRKGSELFTKSMAESLSEASEMLITDEKLMFVDYEDANRNEIYELKDVDFIRITIALVDNEGQLLFEFHTKSGQEIKPRYIQLGKRKKTKQEAWSLYSRQLDQLSGHVDIHYGDDIVHSSGPGFTMGVGFIRDMG